jgi:hypothetical protein
MEDGKRDRRIAAIAVALTPLVLAAAGLVFWLHNSGGPVESRNNTQVSPRSETAPISGWVINSIPGDARVATYTADFSTAVIPTEFSKGRMLRTKAQARPYLGRFGEAGTMFSLKNAPPHRLIHLVFDLALLNSWNGSSPIWGPDIVKATVVGGPSLMSATFCNCGFFSNNNQQSYPDEFPISPATADPGSDPGTSYPAWTGAAEHETLGEIHSFGANSNPSSGDSSSVYHMDWTFPNSHNDLAIAFTCKVKDKAMKFGFLSFKAEAIADFQHLNKDELKTFWTQLIGTDAVVANTAFWKLAAGENAVVDYMQSAPSAGTWSPAADVITDRVYHLLEVINTPESLKLLASLKSQPIKAANG